MLKNNRYRIYVDIMTGENLSSIMVANIDSTYGSVGFPLGGMDGEDHYFSQLQDSLY